MARYRCEVVETQLLSRSYVVEAASLDDAEHKAAIGDTLEERDISRYPEVINREVLDVDDEPE